MDWIAPLKAQQVDFLKRLKVGTAALLSCNVPGYYSEQIVVAGDQLSVLKDTCWQLAKQARDDRKESIRDGFAQYLPAQLGKAAIANWLGRLVLEVDPDHRLGTRNLTDFSLAANATAGIRVKVCQGSAEGAEWRVEPEEIQANAAIACFIIQEAIDEVRTEYHLLSAGFVPTDSLSSEDSSLKIDTLLYGGGLGGYLESLQTHPSPNLNDADSYFEQGEKCYEKKDFKNALANYNEAIALNPHLDKAFHKRGRTYYEIGNNQDALKDFNKTLHINPDYAKAYLSRGLVRRRLRDYRGAIKDLNQALHFRPNHAKAYINRGLVRYDLKDYEGAIEDYSQAIHIDPKFAEAYAIRGMVRDKLGDKQGAVEDWNEALRANPNHPRACFYRGLARSRLKDYKGAIEDYNKALKINPKFAEAYHYRGTTRAKLGDRENALKDLQQASKLFFSHSRMDKYQDTQAKIQELKNLELISPVNSTEE